jgi:hypothetical protein
VRRWFAERLPLTRAVAVEANRRIRSAALNTVAGRGATILSRVQDIGLRAAELEAFAVTAGVALKPWRGLYRDADREQLCRCCLVLARLEQCYRAWPATLAHILPAFAANRGSIREVARGCYSESSVKDLVRLGRVIVEDHMDLKHCGSLTLNPTFVQSAALGGADGDVIAAGLLLDLKASATTQVVGRHELWQLVGYALADTDNTHHIHAVGVSALRWRTWATWPIDSLLLRLDPTAPQSLDQWRSEFAALLSSAPRPLRRASRSP